jgi:hypothetical protein
MFSPFTFACLTFDALPLDVSPFTLHLLINKFISKISCGIYRWLEMLSFKLRPSEKLKAQRSGAQGQTSDLNTFKGEP